jgi:hypothetical protein
MWARGTYRLLRNDTCRSGETDILLVILTCALTSRGVWTEVLTGGHDYNEQVARNEHCIHTITQKPGI